MIDKVLLALWLTSLPGVPDHEGRPIRRPEGAAKIIAEVTETLPLPFVFAAQLDVLGAMESGYDAAAVGDSGNSCGAWQTPCAETPMPAGWHDEFIRAKLSGDRAQVRAAHAHRLAGITREMRLGQAKVAIKWLLASLDTCPEHVLWQYAAGRCVYSDAARDREVRVRRELQFPIPSVE